MQSLKASMSGVDECLDNQDRSHRKQGRRQRSSTWEHQPILGTWGYFSPCLVKGKNPSQVGYHIPWPRSSTQELWVCLVVRLDLAWLEF